MDIDKIYKEYFETVYKYLLYLTHNEDLSEELTQETFYKAIRNIDQFKEKSSILTWLIQIARNLYFDEFKRNKKLEELAELEYKIYDKSIEDTIVSNEEKTELKQRINELNETHKKVVLLRISGELGFKEIGLLFNKSETWARVTFYRAKNKLMKGVDNNDK